MMLGIPVLILAAATASNSTEGVSIRCATAVAKAVAHWRSTRQTAGEQTPADGDTAGHDRGLCVQSRKDPGSTYVSLLDARPLVYHHGPVYLVDVSGDVQVLSGRPCELNPSVCE
jgi:hypothetical protein